MGVSAMEMGAYSKMSAAEIEFDISEKMSNFLKKSRLLLQKSGQLSAAALDELLKLIVRVVRALIRHIAGIFGVKYGESNGETPQGAGEASRAGGGSDKSMSKASLSGDAAAVAQADAVMDVHLSEMNRVLEDLIQKAPKAAHFDADVDGPEATPVYLKLALSRLGDRIDSLKAQHAQLVQNIQPMMKVAAETMGMGSDLDKAFQLLVSKGDATTAKDGFLRLVDPKGELRPQIQEIKAIEEETQKAINAFCGYCAAAMGDEELSPVAMAALEREGFGSFRAKVEEIIKSSNNVDSENKSIAEQKDSRNNLLQLVPKSAGSPLVESIERAEVESVPSQPGLGRFASIATMSAGDVQDGDYTSEERLEDIDR